MKRAFVMRVLSGIVIVSLAVRTALAAGPAPELLVGIGANLGAPRFILAPDDERFVVTIDSRQVIHQWSLPDFKELAMFSGAVGPDDYGTITAAALSRDGRWLATAVAAKPGAHLRLFRLGGTAGPELIQVTKLAGPDLGILGPGAHALIVDLDFAPDASLLAGVSSSERVLVWLQGFGRLSAYPVSRANVDRPLTACRFTPDGNTLHCYQESRRLMFRRIGTGEFSPVGDRLIGASRPQNVARDGSWTWLEPNIDEEAARFGRLVDPDSRIVELKGKWPPGTDFVDRMAAVDPTGRCAVFLPKWGTGNRRTGAVLVTDSNGSNLRQLEGAMTATPMLYVSAAWLSDDRLLIGGEDGSLELWQTTKNRRIARLAAGCPRVIDWFNDGIDPKTGEPTMTVEFLLCQPRTPAETAVLADFRRLTEASSEPLADAAALAKQEAPLAFDFARLRLFHPCKEIGALELARIFAEGEFDVDPPDSTLGPFFIPGIHQGDYECGILRGRVGDVGSEKVLWRFALFGEDVFKSLPDWVVWTPEGYFACSPRALGRIAWRISHGPDQLATIEPAERFKQQYLRPAIIRRMMATGQSAAGIAAQSGFEPKPPNQ